jgi:hypothetical protein
MHIRLSAREWFNPVTGNHVKDGVFEIDGDAENVATGDEILRVDYGGSEIPSFARALAFDLLYQHLKFPIGWRKGVRIVHDLKNSSIVAFAEEWTYYKIVAHDVILP